MISQHSNMTSICLFWWMPSSCTELTVPVKEQRALAHPAAPTPAGSVEKNNIARRTQINIFECLKLPGRLMYILVATPVVWYSGTAEASRLLSTLFWVKTLKPDIRAKGELGVSLLLSPRAFVLLRCRRGLFFIVVFRGAEQLLEKLDKCPRGVLLGRRNEFPGRVQVSKRIAGESEAFCSSSGASDMCIDTNGYSNDQEQEDLHRSQEAQADLALRKPHVLPVAKIRDEDREFFGRGNPALKRVLWPHSSAEPPAPHRLSIHRPGELLPQSLGCLNPSALLCNGRLMELGRSDTAGLGRSREMKMISNLELCQQDKTNLSLFLCSFNTSRFQSLRSTSPGPTTRPTADPAVTGQSPFSQRKL